MSTHRRIELDSKALRVLAHPLRARLLSELRLRGPANPTALAERLATNTGATSYHLRKLADVGLVEDAAGGRGKERFWAAAQDYHSWRHTKTDDPDAEAAAGWLRQHYWREFADRVARWEEVRTTWPREWQTATGMSDHLITLTAAQARELSAELDEVIRRHMDRAEAIGGDDRQQLSVYLQVLPTEPDKRS